MSIVEKYFTNLTEKQKEQFDNLENLYREWNDKINVISRKDMDSFYIHHVLHALAIAKVIQFQPGTKIMDVGTGGGFPGIPLAIMFPEAQFLLVDSIGKKIRVVNEVAQALGLTNVRAQQTRVENVKEKFDFVVSRGVTAFPAFVDFTFDKINKGDKNALGNGILYLKGGDFEDEIKPFGTKASLYEIPSFFDESFFETKKVIHLKK
ncbi:MAG: 16S rRNA (guanine(527)-N(7))-methyltransferase RsmG [Marinifilaceae bacterium]